MAETSLYAYIKLMGNDDFPLEVVTERLGIQPTRTWGVGEKVHPDKPLERFYTCWIYKIDQLETLAVEDVLHPLYNLFNPKVEIINQLKQRFNLTVQIELVIEMENGRTPGLVISPEFSRFASSMDALIDIDMYVYPFSGEEE